VASIDKRPDGTYRARLREYPGGPQRTKSFQRKVDATAWLVKVQHDLATGVYVAARAGLTTVAAYASEWTGRRQWRPATRDRVDRELRLYILPAFGRRPLSSVRRAHVEEWAAALPLAPSTAAAAAQTFAALMAAAVDDERVAKNPCVGARLPKPEDVPVVPLTVEQVRLLAQAAPDHLRAGVVLAAGTGLRQGEAMAVSTDRLNMLKRELRVDRQLWSPVKGRPVFAPPKSARGYRTIALSPLVVDALAAHLGVFGPGGDGLVFHRDGAPISRHAVGWHMRNASKRAGVDATWHDLRHHHASVLLSAGVSPALVAERLGHTLGELLKTYAHVIRSDEDRVRGIVDATLGGSAEDWLRTSAAG
jgi:integrase